MKLRSFYRFATTVNALCLASGFLAHSHPLRPLPSSSFHPALSSAASTSPGQMAVIPGPLRSFLRMAGISQKVPLDQVLPALSHNVELWGRQSGKETEYLVLLTRYVELAREIESFAGPDGSIRIADCDQASRLLPAIGYRFKGVCGQKNASLITANSERAFLTLDSGFPLTELEQALDRHTPFSTNFPSTQVPIVLTQAEWLAIEPGNKKGRGDIVDLLLQEPDVDRLYEAMARSDDETRKALAHSPGLKTLLANAALFNFYGNWIVIRSGRVAVPGGDNTERSWQELVGASPSSPGEFVNHLLSRDHGWIAAYYDALSRLSQEQSSHLMEGSRLKNLYDAYRQPVNKSSAAASVFPKNAQLLQLFTRLQWDGNGKPEVPGNEDLWKDVFIRAGKSSGFRDVAMRARSLDSPDQLLAELVESSNLEAEGGPLELYLTLSAIDSGRGPQKHLSNETARLLADRFAEFEEWYPVFVEFPSLDDKSVKSFLDVADRIDKTSNLSLRTNALGAFQADIGLWQILARQGQIPDDSLSSSWQNAIHPFTEIGSNNQLFEAARSSLQAILVSAGADKDLSQDQLVELLAGPDQQTPDGRRVRQELARRIRAVMDDQHLVSLDTLFGLYDGLNDMAHGASIGDRMLLLAADLREFELPRPIFTAGEKTSWSPVIYTSRHAELQVRTDLSSVIKTPGTPAQLQAARSRLTPFLRDTLVGLNYAYYEPPSAQVLHNNPLFVRAHDFSTVSVQGVKRTWGEPQLIGVGVTAGGGAFLMGSLADLPYALASVEQDFIAPENVQALVWKETVPQLIVDAVLPRWWNVSAREMHAAALYQRAGEELVASSASNPELRRKVMNILSGSVAPGHLDQIESALNGASSPTELASQLLPVNHFYLAAEFRRLYPGQAAGLGPANRELEDLAHESQIEFDPDRLSRDFGVPHPVMERSDARTLANSGVFPASGGYTSRLFSESWDSSNLYWARLADEKGYSPVMLNVLVPMLTRHMIVKIFASNNDDWPALLRAMQETGEDFRQGKISVKAEGVVPGQ